MSLINEALKKAQRQRHQSGPVGDGATVDTAERPIQAQPPAWRASVVVAATSGSLLIIGAVVFLALRWLAEEPAPPPFVRSTPKSTAPASPVAAAPAPAAAPRPETPSPTPVPAKTSAEPSTPAAPAPARAPAATPAETGPAAGSPAATSATAAETSPVAGANSSPIVLPLRAARPDERIPAYIESLRVAGVRLLEGDSRILLNDRVFRLNDMVDRSLGLKLVEARPGTLVFIDAHGFRYEKKF
jgi:hypothetical protein